MREGVRHVAAQLVWLALFALLLLCGCAERPHLYVVSGDYCPPCRELHRSLESPAVRGELAHFRVEVLNVTRSPEEAGRLGIETIPTLIVFRGGVEAGRLVGWGGREPLVEWLKEQRGAE